ncbi:NUDIX hydrolase [Nanoarchaeota archaeon]
MKKIELAGCVILDDNRILLLHREKRDWYELPGGKIDEGESPKEAAKREIKEELGCDVEIIRELGEKDFQEEEYIMKYNWFLAILKGTPKLMEPDTFSHYKYISLDQLENYKLSPNMENLYKEIKEKRIKLA